MPQSNRQKLEALTAQKKALSAELEALKKQRAKARMDGVPFDNADRIKQAEAELEEIEDAGALAQQYVEQDEVRALAAMQADHAEAQIKALDGVRADYLAAVGEIEQATAALAAGFAKVHSAMPRLNQIAMDITGSRNLPEFQKMNYESRLVARLAHGVADHISGFAAFQMSAADELQLLRSWVDEEERKISNTLAHPISKLRARVDQLRAESRLGTE